MGGTLGFHPSARGDWSSVLLASLTFALLFLHTFCLSCHFLCDFWSVFSLSLIRVDLFSWFFSRCLTQSEAVRSSIPEVYRIIFFRKYFFELCSVCDISMGKNELLKNPHNYFCLPTFKVYMKYIALPFSTCLSFISWCCDKSPWQEQLREKGFIRLTIPGNSPSSWESQEDRKLKLIVTLHS